MAALLGAFLLWLFATGKYADWVALASAPKKVANFVAEKAPATTGTAPASAPAQTTQSQAPTELIRVGTDWLSSWANTASYGSDSGSNTEPAANLYPDSSWTESA